jgi:hypothetical protein
MGSRKQRREWEGLGRTASSAAAALGAIRWLSLPQLRGAVDFKVYIPYHLS